MKSRKMKVSKQKHSNQVITKLKKQGKIKSQRHKKKKIIMRQPQKPVKHKAHHDSDNESVQGTEMMDMMDKEDLDYLMTSIVAKNEKKSERRKRKSPESNDQSDEEKIENEYESTIEVPSYKRQKQLLPIKTRDGFQMRTIDMDERKNKETEGSGDEGIDEEVEEEEEEQKNGEELSAAEDEPDNNIAAVSATDLYIARHKELQHKKRKIGILCSNILESPENNIGEFFPLLYLMDEIGKTGSENLITVRKLSMISLLEVFKDILPDYQITQQNFGDVKLKKETLALNKYEDALLGHYKRYLTRLEKIASVLSKKKGDTRKVDTGKNNLATIAVTCLCDMLVTHPYFNYSSNIAQMLVPLLNNRVGEVRHTVNDCFKTIFKSDTKALISLMIVRKINQFVKNKSSDVNCEVLDCLLSLRIKDVNLEEEKKLEMKQKKQMSHKQRLISMSKRERKRGKKLKELEKEMLETKAEESKQSKQQNLSEITKAVFNIYFRVLKRSPNSKLLGATLEGLSKFAHIMNVDYFSDLINVLNSILADEDLGYRERLHCVETVFAVLSGQGEVLNIDPTRFYTHLYEDLLTIHAGKNQKDLIIVLRALTSVLIKRRKKISQQILLSFLKRVTTLSTQVMHHGALGCLAVIKTVMQQSKQSEVLLDLDDELGSGHYDPYLMEPEYCGASTTALFELSILRHHYHPTVRTIATNIVNGLPASGEGSLPSEIARISPEEFFEQYDGSTMGFKPAIPVPKKAQPKSRPGRHIYTHPVFEDYCKTVANVRLSGPFDFSEVIQSKNLNK